MDLSTLVQTLQEQLGTLLPRLLGALVILILGWFVALAIRAAIRKLGGAAKLNERVASGPDAIDLESGLATGAYYVVLVLVLVAFLEVVGLELVSAPLQGFVDQFLSYLPKLIAGGVLLLVAVVIASVVRNIARGALSATSLDDRLSASAGMSGASDHLAGVLYWLVLLLFLPAVLGAFELAGLLDPVRGMMENLLAALPKIFAALVIGLVGWLVARIVRDLVSNLLAAAGADRLGASMGLTGNFSLSRMVGLVLYVLILLPVVTAALDALEMEAVTAPASTMLATITGALPNVFAAIVILAIAYFVARFAAELVTQLLSGLNFDTLPARLGVPLQGQGAPSLSKGVGTLIVFFTMLFAVVEAANRIGFVQVSDLISTFIAFGSQILLGTVIIAIGFWLSNLAGNAIRRLYGDDAAMPANIARFSILGLVVAMGLRAMGLADDIVNLAFGLTLGAIAVAVALSFGLGGREAAGRQVEHWLSRMRG